MSACLSVCWAIGQLVSLVDQSAFKTRFAMYQLAQYLLEGFHLLQFLFFIDTLMSELVIKKSEKSINKVDLISLFCISISWCKVGVSKKV